MIDKECQGRDTWEIVVPRGEGGGENFLMSGIQVCTTDQGRFFTSKNLEQALTFEVFLQNKP